LLGVVHDEHAFHIQLDTAALVAIPQIERRASRMYSNCV
jgi:hypothetical protein